MIRNSILLALSIVGAGLAFQSSADDSHKHHAAGAAKQAVAANAALIDGEVRKVDKAEGRITIKHGAMPKFDMPPMTMAYRAKDKAMVDQVKAGDRIRFDAENAGGEFTLLRLEKAK